MTVPTAPAGRNPLLVMLLALLMVTGCVTITETVEEPVPIRPSPTATPEASLDVTPLVQGVAELQVTPTAESSPTPTATASPTPPVLTYTVQAGETLNVIAKRYAVSLAALLAANSMTDADTVQVGQELIIPTAYQLMQVEAESGTPVPTPQTETGHIIHFIRVGETLSAIATLHNIDRLDLLHANGLRPEAQLTAGDTLIIPRGSYTPVPTATVPVPTVVPTVVVILEPSPTPSATARATRTPSAAVTAAATATVTETVSSTASYTVQPGDYAKNIAQNHGITVEALAAANPGVNLDRLSIGSTLVIPVASGAALPPTATPSATVTLTPGVEESTATPEPTATPTVVATHVVAEGETLETIAQQYGITEESLRSSNTEIGDSPEVGLVLQVPVPTPTPTATPTTTPTAPPAPTATPAPEYPAPIPLLPANGTNWIYHEGRAPLQLVWTSSGILREDEFYVVRLRSLDRDGNIIWSGSHWTRNPGWRLSEQLMKTDLFGASTDRRVTLRWDVMVMRRTSSPGEEPQTGVALSEKSATHELVFINSQ
jgi:LysM repeat protein